MAPSSAKIMRRPRFEDLLFEEDRHIHSGFENLLAIAKKLAKDHEGRKPSGSFIQNKIWLIDLVSTSMGHRGNSNFKKIRDPSCLDGATGPG